MRKQGPHWNALLTEVRILECPKMHVEDHAHIEDTSLSKSYYFCMWADMGGMGCQQGRKSLLIQVLYLMLPMAWRDSQASRDRQIAVDS
eukprot:scaffold101971_cov19-Tisochrysis_lutea.AAC.1